jgi:hypothetical protein
MTHMQSLHSFDVFSRRLLGFRVREVQRLATLEETVRILV